MRINPASRPLGIDSVMIGTSRIDVTQAEIWTAPFCILRQLSRSNAPANRVLVIAPLAGGFAILLRDVFIGLLRYRNVAVMDWLDARYVPTRAGRFGLEDNIAYVISAIRALGPDLHVVAVCQAVVPAVIATAILSAYDSQAAPRSLILMAGPVDPLTNPTRVVELIRARSLDWFEKHVLETVRALAKTEAFEQSRRDRKRVEMLFAHLKRILKLGRLRLRGPRARRIYARGHRTEPASARQADGPAATSDRRLCCVSVAGVSTTASKPPLSNGAGWQRMASKSRGNERFSISGTIRRPSNTGHRVTFNTARTSRLGATACSI
jgi:hypothetical protein